jgi:hypothetical protein
MLKLICQYIKGDAEKLLSARGLGKTNTSTEIKIVVIRVRLKGVDKKQ